MNKNFTRKSYTLFPASNTRSIDEAPYPIKDPTPSGDDPPKHFAALSRRPSYDSSDRSKMEALLAAPIAELATAPFVSARAAADRDQDRRAVLASWHSVRAPIRPAHAGAVGQWGDTGTGRDDSRCVALVAQERILGLSVRRA